MADARVLGYKQLVGGFGPDQFASDDAVKALADKINAVVDRYVSRGFTVNYHNHWWEYDAANRGEQLLALCPKLQPQFDIYWIATGGADPAKLIAKYAKRTTLLHIKDGPCVKAKPMTAVGKGKVDVAMSVADDKIAGLWRDMGKGGLAFLQFIDQFPKVTAIAVA